MIRGSARSWTPAPARGLAVALAAAVIAGCQAISPLLGGPDVQTTPPVWSTAIVGGNYERAAPLVVGSRVIANIGRRLVALDEASGAVLWMTPLDTGYQGASSGSNLMRAGPRVVMANNGVAAFDVSTGALAWRFLPSGNSGLANNAADSDLVVVGTEGPAVYAIDATTGAQRWRTDPMPACVYRCIARGIALSGDTVYAVFDVWLSSGGGLSLGRVVALARSDGHVLWSWDTSVGSPQHDNIGAGPVVFKSVLLLVDTRGGSSFALDRFARTELWRRPSAGSAAGPDTRFLVYRDTAFLGGVDGNVYALDPVTGSMFWQQNVGSSITSEGAICNGRVMSQNFALRAHDTHTGGVVRAYRVTGGPLISGVGVSAMRAFVKTQTAVNAFDC